MPSTSKSQQRLFGWALSCKRGLSKDCPPSIQKIADSMSESELEKFAATSHEGLPDKVREALEEIYDLYNDLCEAEACEVCKGASKRNKTSAEDEKCLGGCGNYVSPEVNSKFVGENEKIDEGVSSKIQQPKGETLKAAKQTPASKNGKVDTKLPPAVDNKSDEKDITPGIPPGIEKAGEKPLFKFTPSLFKLPGEKAKHDRRVFDFNDFLKIINYKTHDGITQKGHGQNLTGGNAN
jgi:hypothetical protein